MICIPGARPQSGKILAMLSELNEAQDKLADRRLHLQQVEAELSSIHKSAAR